MERVAEWLTNIKVIDKDVASYICSPAHLSEELQDGVILARIAAELDPSLLCDSSDASTHRNKNSIRNANVFIDAYRQIFR